MIRLITAELTRLRMRRAVLVLVAAAFVVPLVIGIGTTWNTRPYSADDIAAAREQASQQPGFEQEVRRCERHPRRAGVQSAEKCEAQVLSWYTGLYREPLALKNELQNSGLAVASVVLLLMVLAGTTFAGADWTSGSMSNQLLFEPRRLRVWLAKAIALMLASTLIALGVQILYWSGLYAVAASRDLTNAPGLTGEVAWEIARSTWLTAAGALTAFALTMLVRSTVFTLGALFAVSALGTFLVALLPLGDDKERWLPPTNVAAIIQGQARYYSEPPVECMDADFSTMDAAMRQVCNGTRYLTVWDGLLFVMVPLVLIVALSVWSFRRRDVP